jgi:hypothetical protein
VFDTGSEKRVVRSLKRTYNGTVCIDKRDERPYGVQMVIPNEKLTNLKYELRMAIIHGVMIVLLFF